MGKTALQRLVDGPDEDCQRGAVEQHFFQDRGKCACMVDIVEGVSKHIAELEAALRPFARYDVRTGATRVDVVLEIADIDAARRVLGLTTSAR